MDTEDLSAPGIEANKADLARIEALRGERVNEKMHHLSEAIIIPEDIEAEEAVIDALAGRSV